MIYLYLFITFFQIGLFGFGGGYGMLSLIQGEVVHNHGWLTTGEFTDIVAISQMTPGPIGINSATYCGYDSRINLKMTVCFGNSHLCAGAAVAHTYDTHIAPVHEIYEHAHGSERFLRSSSCRCRTARCSYSAAYDSRELQCPVCQSLAVLD